MIKISSLLTSTGCAKLCAPAITCVNSFVFAFAASEELVMFVKIVIAYL